MHVHNAVLPRKPRRGQPRCAWLSRPPRAAATWPPLTSLTSAVLCALPLHLCRKVAEQVDIQDLPEDLGKIATTLLEDKTGTQVGAAAVGCGGPWRFEACAAALREDGTGMQV